MRGHGPSAKPQRECRGRRSLNAVLGPMLTLVQEEVTLRRPAGGPVVLHRQQQRLPELAQLGHVTEFR
ncbi:Scr1 family TA system antitoxin-like transcriptional regulator [Streptomyces qinglanensis]|uniref:Scr1 family TA system antitoxin-like transcriptional regulator n=1 Tax=Streptomyces qinglanensis TaxID=943816 RepID=UPI003D706A3C